jgi:uncharacterized RDD family membrane protein YckC
MKCPKCNYVSFDNLNNCKKCGFVFKESGTESLTFSEPEGTPREEKPPDVSEAVNSIRESLAEIDADKPLVTGDVAEDRSDKSGDNVMQFRNDATSIKEEDKFSGANEINWEESISLESDVLNLDALDLDDEEEGEGKALKLADEKPEIPDSMSEQLKEKLEKIGEELKQIEEEPAPGEPVYQSEEPDTGFDPSTVKKGGFWIRLLASMIDGIILNVISLVLGFIGVIAMGLGPDGLSGIEDLESQGLLGLIVPLYIFIIIMNIAYYTYFHGRTGQTLGKMACSLRVVSLDGEPLGYGRAFFRWLLFMVFAVIFLLGGVLNFLWPIWSKHKQAWHDKIVGTYVIKL